MVCPCGCYVLLVTQDMQDARSRAECSSESAQSALTVHAASNCGHTHVIVDLLMPAMTTVTTMLLLLHHWLQLVTLALGMLLPRMPLEWVMTRGHAPLEVRLVGHGVHGLGEACFQSNTARWLSI